MVVGMVAASGFQKYTVPFFFCIIIIIPGPSFSVRRSFSFFSCSAGIRRYVYMSGGTVDLTRSLRAFDFVATERDSFS